jgi:hypothetical protein
MAREVHVEVLEFGGTAPSGAYLIPFPRKADGTPDFGRGIAGMPEVLEAEKQGHNWIVLECPPHA